VRCRSNVPLGPNSDMHTAIFLIDTFAICCYYVLMFNMRFVPANLSHLCFNSGNSIAMSAVDMPARRITTHPAQQYLARTCVHV
jgi:hypothetical protein